MYRIWVVGPRQSGHSHARFGVSCKVLMQAVSKSWAHGIRRAFCVESFSRHIAQWEGDEGLELSLAMFGDG